MGFCINFCTNVISGLPLLCADSFWTSSYLPSASKSNPPLLLAHFGLPRASPPPQSPIHRSFSLLLDFLVPPLHLKVQFTAPSHSFWTSSCLPATLKSNPPLFSITLFRPTTQKRRIAKQSASLIPPILIRQSNSTISMPVISQFHQVKHLQ